MITMSVEEMFIIMAIAIVGVVVCAISMNQNK